MRTFQLHIKESGTAGQEWDGVKCVEKYGGLNETPHSLKHVNTWLMV